jgi:hypothetical protein
MNLPEAKVFGSTCPKVVAVEGWVALGVGNRSSLIEVKRCMIMESKQA